ncbi:MAG TPA: glycosyltransferase family 4 protein, partial [Candidatus Diapherotrites archaeon]|nr:glycosyltransferase family 4 protein [Candidatus Diapherotrites archaeon]
MKIARLVGGFHEDATSGLNPNIYFVSGWQARQGHDVHVFALRKGKPEVKQVNGFILHYVGKPPLFRLFGGMALLQAVKESGFKPEVVHGLQLVPFGWLFPLARQKVNAKYVLSLHTSLNEGRHGFLRGWKAWLNAWEYGVLARFLARQVDLVLPIADFIVEEVRAGGVSADRVQVVRTGVDFKRFNEGRQPAREKQGRKNFVLLYVGRAAQKKGLTYLVRAMALLKDKDLRLRLVGCMKT